MNLLHYLRIYSAGPALFSLGMKIAAEARLFRISIAVIARARRPLKRPLIFQAPLLWQKIAAHSRKRRDRGEPWFKKRDLWRRCPHSLRSFAMTFFPQCNPHNMCIGHSRVFMQRELCSLSSGLNPGSIRRPKIKSLDDRAR